MNKEFDKLICPKCEQSFRDMRGLTSHARHKHNLGKDELLILIESPDSEDKEDGFWKVLGGIGTALLVLITLGRLR